MYISQLYISQLYISQLYISQLYISQLYISQLYISQLYISQLYISQLGVNGKECVVMMRTIFRQFFCCCFVSLDMTKKPSSRGHAVQHLESSSIKVIMNGPNVRKLCVRRRRETHRCT